MQGERQPGLGGRGGGAQRQDGVAFGAGGAGEADLAVLLDDALGERAAVDGGLPGSMARSRGRTERERRTRPTSRQVTSAA